MRVLQDGSLVLLQGADLASAGFGHLFGHIEEATFGGATRLYQQLGDNRRSSMALAWMQERRQGRVLSPKLAGAQSLFASSSLLAAGASRAEAKRSVISVASAQSDSRS